MINKIKHIKSNQHNPYLNLALEEYLFENVKEEECILYLWQNEKTVVVGRNQNPWKECKVRELEGDGGHLVRRLSGGGAVFHDLGNLNFTFLVQKPGYDVNKQLKVIIKALANLGIKAEKSGRNDITVKDRKFSGNAFYFEGNRCYHHGTLLIDVNMDHLSKYLNVSRDKLESKGVDSVKSRVTNLIEHKEDLTIDLMNREMINAFSSVYNLHVEEIFLEEIDKEGLMNRRDKFASWDWLYGTKIPFIYNIDKRFPWGNFEIQINANKGKIAECKVYSDAMDVEVIDNIKEALIGTTFSSKEMVEAIKDQMDKHVLSKDNNMIDFTEKIRQEQVRQTMIDDICGLIIRENL